MYFKKKSGCQGVQAARNSTVGSLEGMAVPQLNKQTNLVSTSFFVALVVKRADFQRRLAMDVNAVPEAFNLALLYLKPAQNIISRILKRVLGGVAGGIDDF